MEASSDKEMTLRDLAGIYQRRRKIIHSVTLAILLLAGLYCVISTRRYEASATVEVRKEGADAMGLQEMMSGPVDGASDALEGNILIETQAAILRSDSLALKTIQELHLEQTADFKPHWNLMNWLVALTSPRGLPDSEAQALKTRQHGDRMRFKSSRRISP